MHCELFRSLLDDLQDGRLTREQLAQMEEHAAACPHCRALMQMQQDLRALNAEAQVPPAFHSSWRQAIRQEKRTLHFPAAVKSMAAAAAAVLFLTGGTLIHRRQNTASLESTPMMLRAMPEPMAQKSAFLTFFSDMGAFLLNILPYLGALAIAAALLILIKKRKEQTK